MPYTGSPDRVKAISVPQAGMPEMNDFVPSIGSSTQTYSASARSWPNSSPMMPWSGNVRRMSARIAISAAWSAAVTGSKLPGRPLSSMLSAVRKNGRIVSPETVARSFTKAEKSIAVIAPAPSPRCPARTYRRPAWRATGVLACRPGGTVRPRGCRPVLGRCKAGFMSIQSRSASPPGMAAAAVVVLVGTLISIYIVSQFLRNSVGVIAPNLAAELGLSPAELGTLSSAFFFAFAAVQIPLGMALDRFGPRRCLVVCAAITVAGAILFASATSPGGLILARVLLGLGASASLMAPLAVFARRFPAERFATLAGLQVGLGTIGTLIATAPLAFSTMAIGWRGSFLVLAAVICLIGIVLAAVVNDDGAGAQHGRRETFGESVSGILMVIRTPSLGRLFVMQLVAY